MKRPQCLLVDDEPLGRAVLRRYVENSGLLDIAGSFGDGLEAFRFLQNHRVDVLFLDIRMPGLTGVDLLRSLPGAPKAIFTTAHREFAFDGFELNAVDYLLKPISFDRFLRAVHKALSLDPTPPPTAWPPVTERFLYLRADREMVKVFLKDIFHVEALKDYLRIHTTQGPVITKQTITHMQEQLPADLFQRVHRSYVVNLTRVESYSTDEIRIRGMTFPIGPSYRDQVLKRLQP